MDKGKAIQVGYSFHRDLGTKEYYLEYSTITMDFSEKGLNLKNPQFTDFKEIARSETIEGLVKSVFEKIPEEFPDVNNNFRLNPFAQGNIFNWDSFSPSRGEDESILEESKTNEIMNEYFKYASKELAGEIS